LLFKDRHDTHHLLPDIQKRLSREIAGARIDVRQLETGEAVGLPVAIRIMGEDIPTLCSTAATVTQILQDIPLATRVRDNWGEDRFNIELAIDPDRANLAGVTKLEVVAASLPPATSWKSRARTRSRKMDLGIWRSCSPFRWVRSSWL
jgi:multidrug efflux pump subunit AcrB